MGRAVVADGLGAGVGAGVVGLIVVGDGVGETVGRAVVGDGLGAGDGTVSSRSLSRETEVSRSGSTTGSAATATGSVAATGAAARESTAATVWASRIAARFSRSMRSASRVSWRARSNSTVVARCSARLAMSASRCSAE